MVIDTLPTWAQTHFPARGDTAAIEAWTPHTQYRALSSTVIAMATTRIEGTWRAYIDGVPGHDHGDEWQAVLAHGAALDEHIAAVVFPEFAGIPYAR